MYPIRWARQGEFRMGYLLDDIVEESREEGRIEGEMEGEIRGFIQAGITFGQTKESILEQLKVDKKISLEQAVEYYDKVVSELSSVNRVETSRATAFLEGKFNQL